MPDNYLVLVQTTMVGLVAYWLYLWVVFFLAGFACLRLLHRAVPRLLPSYRVADIVWCGIAAVTWLGMVASLAMPITGCFHLAILAALAGYALLDRRALAGFVSSRLAIEGPCRRDWWRFLLALAFVSIAVLFAALISNGPPTAYDTCLYHAQSVRWIKEHRVIPGLANLYGRLGFNNAWFVTAAFLDVGPFDFRSFHVVNSMAYVFVVLTLIIRFVYGIGRPLTFAWLFDTALLYPLLHYSAKVNSLSTDVIASLLVFAVISHVLHLLDRDDRTAGACVWALVLIPFAVTVKLIAVPLLAVIPLLLMRLREPSQRPAAFIAANRGIMLAALWLPALVVLPWVARNIVLTGYLVFPFAAIDWVRVDWKVPRELTLEEAAWTRSWARVPGLTPDQVLGRGLEYWIARWPAWTDPIFRTLTHILVAWLVVTAVFVRRMKARLERLWPVILVLTLGLAYWFAQAPAVRYGYGFIIAAQALMAVMLVDLALDMLPDSLAERGRQALAFLFAVCVVFALLSATRQAMGSHTAAGYALTDYPRVATVPYTYPSGLTVQTPAQGDCTINEPGLCTPGRFRDRYDLVPRSPRIESGFRQHPKSKEPDR